MNEAGDFNILILLVAGLSLATVLIKAGLSRTSVPSMVGFLLLGTGLRLAHNRFGFLEGHSLGVLNFLAQIGLFVLLFKVGLESKLAKLLGQLRQASLLWAANVVLTWVISFFAAQYLPGVGRITALVLATALTATSVGVTISVWQEAGALDTRLGSLLVDVAELDDISAVVLMAVLFAVLPVLHGGTGEGGLGGLMLSTVGWLLVKFTLFVALCVLFSAYVGQPLAAWFRRLAGSPGPMLMITGLALMISALAGMLGFSLAVGAFLAGLMFSRDPATLEMETSFFPLHDFFAPFFFIGLGFDIDPASLGGTVGLGLGLTAVAVAGKFLANGLPLRLNSSAGDAALMGISMIPRAEIAMVIVQQGRRLGDWAVSSQVYGAMVMVSLVSCILAPPLVRGMLRRRPPRE